MAPYMGRARKACSVTWGNEVHRGLGLPHSSEGLGTGLLL